MVWAKNDIDKAILRVFSEQLPLIEFKNNKAISKKADLNKEYMHELTRLNNDVISCEEEKVSLYERYRTGNISKENFIDARSALIEKQKKIKIEIKKIQDDLEDAEGGAYTTPQELKQGTDQESFESLSDEKKIAFIYQFIDQIIIYKNGQMQITWKLTNKFREKVQSSTAVSNRNEI